MALLLDGAAFATDFLHQASLLSLKSSPVRQKLRFVARVPPVRSPSADPMRVGAILEIVNPISGEAATFDLPPAGWSTLGDGLLQVREPGRASRNLQREVRGHQERIVYPGSSQGNGDHAR